jgi:hypothetical protein
MPRQTGHGLGAVDVAVVQALRLLCHGQSLSAGSLRQQVRLIASDDAPHSCSRNGPDQTGHLEPDFFGGPLLGHPPKKLAQVRAQFILAWE